MKKLLFILLILCSCGFEPLYKENTAPLGQVSISNEIFVEIIPDREGQILRDLLQNKISRAGNTAKYRLQVNLNIRTSDLGINIDDVATRKILWVSADFKLIEGDEVLFKGKTANNVSYAVNDNEFITLNARNDEIEKSLQIIAAEIKLKISSSI